MLIHLLLMFQFSHSGGAPVLLGQQAARYQWRDSSFRLPNYENNGYSQQVKQMSSALEIVVKTGNAPLKSSEPARQCRGLPSELAGLQHGLNQQKLLVDQIVYLQAWMRETLQYNAALSTEDPSQVLRSKGGNCVGFCNFFQWVLKHMDVPTRFATGVAFKPGDAVTVRLEGGILHRWVEVFYPDRGWVFCDPSGKVNFVEATYLLLGLEGEVHTQLLYQNALGAEVELMGFEDGLWPAMQRHDVDGRLRLRAN